MTILGYSRKDGRPVALVESASKPGLFHVTTESSCSCKGFSYRHRCSHLPAGEATVVRVPLIRYA